jgi:hypothetical protein
MKKTEILINVENDLTETILRHQLIAYSATPIETHQ